MRPRFQWDLGRRTLPLGERTLIMGVLNVTPDSFSDGGLYFDPKTAVAHGIALLDEGADILDIGGESTRPGVPIASGSAVSAPAVSAEEELRRVLPVIQAIKRERPNSVLSIDTYKSIVARRAIDAGAEIVNDVSGFTWDAAMAPTIAERPCGAILMHVRGLPHEWRTLPPATDIVSLVREELRALTSDALDAGILRRSLVLDPGFGFGKNFDENYPLLAHFADFQILGLPLLAAVSRKSFLGHTLSALLRAGAPYLPQSANVGSERPTPHPDSELAPSGAPYLPQLANVGSEPPALPLGSNSAAPSFPPSPNVVPLPPAARDTASLAAAVAAVLAGAHIVRVHAVRPAVEALAIADAILNAQ